MSEQTTETAPAETDPQPGPITRMIEKVEQHLSPEVHAAEHLAATVAGDVKSIAKTHAGVFGVVTEALNLIEFIDPADAAAIKAAEALVTKLFKMASTAAAAGAAALAS